MKKEIFHSLILSASVLTFSACYAFETDDEELSSLMTGIGLYSPKDPAKQRPTCPSSFKEHSHRSRSAPLIRTEDPALLSKGLSEDLMDAEPIESRAAFDSQLPPPISLLDSAAHAPMEVLPLRQGSASIGIENTPPKRKREEAHDDPSDLPPAQPPLRSPSKARNLLGEFSLARNVLPESRKSIKRTSKDDSDEEESIPESLSCTRETQKTKRDRR